MILSEIPLKFLIRGMAKHKTIRTELEPDAAFIQMIRQGRAAPALPTISTPPHAFELEGSELTPIPEAVALGILRGTQEFCSPSAKGWISHDALCMLRVQVVAWMLVTALHPANSLPNDVST
mmetsp:Transcript_12899/g.33036  ORF Transcript_12899/g.33036 Transcript_12899/m.33036 type:complete len:122 (-) Transcript_12899:244-609(-)